MIHPILFHIIVAIASLAIIAKAADLLVLGASGYSRKIGAPEFLIGVVVVGIGTCLPELMTSMTGAMIGQAAIVFGTIMGSNLFKLPLLGLSLIVNKNIKINLDTLGATPLVTLIIALLPMGLVIDGTLTRIDGVILLGLYVYYISRLWSGAVETGKLKESVKVKEIIKEAFIFLGSLVALLLGARFLVFSSVQLSSILSISPFLIGVLVLGIGGSIPEFIVQLRANKRKSTDLAIGNVIGSILANSALVLGLVAVMRPLAIDIGTLAVSIIFLVAGLLLLFIFISKERMTFREGITLISLFVLYLIVQALV